MFLFATVVGNVGDVISNLNAARMEFQGKYVACICQLANDILQILVVVDCNAYLLWYLLFRMDGIKFYMTHHTIPEELQGRVKKWAEYSWNRYRLSYLT